MIFLNWNWVNKLQVVLKELEYRISSIKRLCALTLVEIFSVVKTFVLQFLQIN